MLRFLLLIISLGTTLWNLKNGLHVYALCTMLVFIISVIMVMDKQEKEKE